MVVPPSRSRSFAATATALAALLACAERVEVGRDLPDGSGGTAATSSGGTLSVGAAAAGNEAGGSVSTGGNLQSCQPTACQGQIYQCGDCVDNDGDGLVDASDPDCTGPCDNTEDSYFGGIPGQNNAPCRQDCYFDQDTGSGNDHCYWSQDCDPLSVAPAYPPSGDSHCAYDPNATIPGSGATCTELESTQAPECLSYCLPLTPNGCDCFGCCELPADSGNYVWLGSSQQNTGTCDRAHLDDPTACHPCTPVTSCFNACDPCEVCVGRTSPSSACATSGSARCSDGATPCGQSGDADCPTDSYCITGCCRAAPR